MQNFDEYSVNAFAQFGEHSFREVASFRDAEPHQISLLSSCGRTGAPRHNTHFLLCEGSPSVTPSGMISLNITLTVARIMPFRWCFSKLRLYKSSILIKAVPSFINFHKHTHMKIHIYTHAHIYIFFSSTSEHD